MKISWPISTTQGHEHGSWALLFICPFHLYYLILLSAKYSTSFGGRYSAMASKRALTEVRKEVFFS